MSLFSLTNVTFKNIIKYPQIDIKPNKTTFICGKSGTGKSTLLKLLNTSLSSDSGEILYNGRPIESYNTIVLRKEIMFVSQTLFLFDTTIGNNFFEFYSYREQTPLNNEKIKEFSKLCLADFPADTNCREMSGGERQRVFIAICLSFLPKVLMLDEPTSALDDHTSRKLMENLKCYCKENDITLIVITHDILIAEQYADEIISLDSEGEYE